MCQAAQKHGIFTDHIVVNAMLQPWVEGLLMKASHQLIPIIVRIKTADLALNVMLEVVKCHHVC
jgi:hypothetical protein